MNKTVITLVLLKTYQLLSHWARFHSTVSNTPRQLGSHEKHSDFAHRMVGYFSFIDQRMIPKNLSILQKVLEKRGANFKGAI